MHPERPRGRPLRPPGAPVVQGVNWIAVRTLYLKEVRRFFKVQMQTIWAPAVTTLLFLAIFLVALGGLQREVLGVPYARFLGPGLIAMGMIQNAFQNSSSSLVIAKVQGTLVDLLMPPLSWGEILSCLVAGAVTRAWAVGLAIWGAMWLWPGVDVPVERPWLVFAAGTLGAVLLALVGVLTGLWADKFDHAAAVTNFVIQPLTLLSGTFYAIGRLPDWAQILSRANPFFHVIDAFRAGFIGVSEAPVAASLTLVASLCVALWWVAYALLRSGWKTRP
ncbi:ABC transporter permease [Thermaurantiacus sp.]|uniref:ABC transporter permease n=1 Tax=Thermaurantiacus sp. TaxID=2820283 RepID=UPI00298F2B44|nr:ABC transporter permease [Thermaurantiacus sp.]